MTRTSYSAHRSLIVAAWGIAALHMLLVAVGDSGTLRAATGLLFVCFLPGYFLLIILFPFREASLGAVERVVLALALSIALSTSLGLVLSVIPSGLGPLEMAASGTGLTTLLAVGALLRDQSYHAGRLFEKDLASFIIILIIAMAVAVWAGVS